MVYWTVLPGWLGAASLWYQGAWSAKKNPGQLITLPDPPGVRRGGTRRSRTRSKSRSRKTRYAARGGAVKEEALEVLKNNKFNVETFHKELLNGGRSNPTTLDGFTFRAVGHVNLYLQAKRVKENDSMYVEVHFMSDH